MVGRIRRWQQRHWRERSKAERVELYTVVTWHCTVWFIMCCWLLLQLPAGLAHRPVALALGTLLALTAVAQCALANRLTRTALDHYLGRSALPAGMHRAPAALLGLALALIVALAGLDAASAPAVRLAIGGVVLSFALLYGLTVPARVFLRRAAVFTVLLAAVVGLADRNGFGLLATAAITAFQAVFALLAGRCGAWTLSVLWEAERAREVEARLAVAEERLRFGRDLHDVLGRNLSVISLKSELAVQLARRGRPEAVEQMIEVQRIAQESQREVRAVVRGYREADLGAELAGAQGVLAAAGIDCEVRAETGGLPAEVQSALGWVVREATTNVLRHGDAGRCQVGLAVLEGRAVLTVENDGAVTPGGGGGSGLAGLRERLAAVGGTLEAGLVDGGRDRFRLVAEVPLTATRA
ncbi:MULTISPECIES: sensor histidine kinase [unclassified Streptomyces]|uniref:sensor histidine kinase n=1 Tax=Streptomyces TaxID=1883 RepID=UPI000B96DD79|nr:MULTISPECIES: histidine kinase [unclassified Streptomyces]OYP16387.1 histidine kinase [Streptomyces sp. FBKL.4005]BCM68236.1 putative two-component system sensor kinase [Streptomyces sp. EAS-AB2608]